MDGKTFDDLTRSVASGATRRGALGLLAGSALAASLAKIELTDAKKGKGKNKKKKCRKANQSCGGKKKKCCKGLTCTDGTCLNPAPAECDSDNDCGANEVCQNGQCVLQAAECENNNDCDNDEICDDGVCIPEPPECTINNDCGINEICQDGECVPTPECDSDNDCGDNQICDSGTCICPAVVEDRCVIACTGSGDCPNGCDCRRLFPENGQRVCVDDSALCSANSCDNSDDCFGDEMCVGACDGGRCFPVCILGED